jgi:parallel beta-helix repeat protein
MSARFLSLATAGAAAILFVPHPAAAATLCVAPGGAGGCQPTISAAVSAASPGDTIYVHHGTYAEQVTIDKSLSLVGDRRENTIVDATGSANGFTVDGLDNPGLAHVTIDGFTVRNAQTEGILVTNASWVSIVSNRVVDNDQALVNEVCGLFTPPDSAAGEGSDCGEGVHLTGVDHSTVRDNIIERNSGGILISDDSGPTHDNVISGNIVQDNPYDCGITMASHKPVAPNGVYRNTIAANSSLRNGLKGEGAGIGMFTPAPGTATYGNVVVGNRAIGNGMPGIAMHSHAPGQNLTDNKIVDNYVADNGPDLNDAATPGPTGINVYAVSPTSGTTITGNVIERETIAVAIKTPTDFTVQFNNFDNRHVGVANLGASAVDATENWWGCAKGPGAGGCASVTGANVRWVPWLTRPFQTSGSPANNENSQR